MNIKAGSIEQQVSAVEPISEILGRVGQELNGLAGELSRVQGLISPLVFKVSSLEPEFLKEIQAIDHIEQKLVCLSRFLTALGPLTEGHWVLDFSEASQVITLSELSRRMHTPVADQLPPPSGDCELF